MSEQFLQRKEFKYLSLPVSKGVRISNLHMAINSGWNTRADRFLEKADTLFLEI